MDNPPPVVWVMQPENYVHRKDQYVWRIKDAARFGESLRGFSDGGGVLHDLKWEHLASLQPTSIEINNQKNPFVEFCKALDYVGHENTAEFLKKLKVISLNMCDVSSADLIDLLARLQLLEGFSYQDVSFSREDWQAVAEELSRLNLRALDISSNQIETFMARLDIEMIKFSSNPGVDVRALESAQEFVTVRTLIAQELNFTSDTDAEEFLTILPVKFPRLSSLVWDWNMVDPAVMNDKRTKRIIQRLVTIYSELKLGMLAILAYTPDSETKQAVNEIARQLSEANLVSVDIRLFCSKGVEADTPNFCLIMAGNDAERRELLGKIVVENRCSIPNLRQLLPLLSNGGSVPDHRPSLIDFAGLDGAKVRKSYAARPVEREIDIS